jgi:hypothetical protein
MMMTSFMARNSVLWMEGLGPACNFKYYSVS